MTKKLKLFFGILVLLAVFFTACNRQARPVASDRDNIVISIVSEWATLDPRVGNDMLAFTVMSQVYDTLVIQRSDNTLIPGLATRWDISPDGTEYTFYLREGVRFHNGDIMTADDVVFSFERSMASPVTVRITGTIDRVEKIDDLTVKVTLQFPYGPFLACTAQVNLAVVSKRAVEEMGNDTFARNPVGTGPYRFIEWRPGDRMIMEAFTDYWREEARIKHITYRIITDSTTATIALERGEIDMLLVVPASEREHVLRNQNLFFDETPSGATWFIAFNLAEGIFTNPLLREAVSYAVNREDIILGALEGIGVRIDAPYTPNDFGYPVGFRGNPYDPARARQLIAEAGYPDGVTINIRTMESPNYARPSEIIQEQLRVAGFDARLELMERGAFLTDAYTNGQYEIMFSALTALVPDADFHVYIRFHSRFQGGGVNFTFADFPEMDRLLEIGRMSTNQQERLDAYLAVAQLNAELNIWIPLFVPMIGTACVNGIKGLVAHPAQRYHIYDLYWE